MRRRKKFRILKSGDSKLCYNCWTTNTVTIWTKGWGEKILLIPNYLRYLEYRNFREGWKIASAEKADLRPPNSESVSVNEATGRKKARKTTANEFSRNLANYAGAASDFLELRYSPLIFHEVPFSLHCPPLLRIRVPWLTAWYPSPWQPW